MPASIVGKVSKVSNGKKEYTRLILPSKSLDPLNLLPGDEVFIETRADCIIITPTHPREEEE
jgi:antitoxin component of MazEF toxin-antitoxin module